MKTQEQMQHDALRELMAFPPLGLSEYSSDLSVQRRLGKLLTDASLQVVSKRDS